VISITTGAKNDRHQTFLPLSSACSPTPVRVLGVPRRTRSYIVGGAWPTLGDGAHGFLSGRMDQQMTYRFDTSERRRSQRIPQSVPLYVRCLDPAFTFAGNLKTVEVSRHGCVIHVLRPFLRGSELHLDLLHGQRTVTARVVHSHPIGTGMVHRIWTVALELDTPGDVWMVNPPPPAWSKTPEQQRHREKFLSGSNRAIHHQNRW
jgi:hypothetical protein